MTTMITLSEIILVMCLFQIKSIHYNYDLYNSKQFSLKLYKVIILD